MKTLLFILTIITCRVSAQQCPLVPLPNHVETVSGNFILNNNTPITINQPTVEMEANYLQQTILKISGLTLSRQLRSATPAINLILDEKIKPLHPEAYTLEIKTTGVSISAATLHGLFNGISSLIQLLSLGERKANSIKINNWKISDEPKYSWRGLLLDESRHFFGKQVVKEILDWMAFYKLDKFHWHLTDQSGWRLEIQAYPLLALQGGIGNFSDSHLPAQFYTQEEIKEIISYAAERFIDVIPEIDMPGHATAANKAYPMFSGGGSDKNPEFTFNPGLDSTYTYLANILKETDALFPSQMIHLGGDEVSYGNEKWKTNVAIKELMQQNGLADIVAVEHYFTQRMADTLFKLNNKVLLWDEATDADLPKNNTIIFWWRHDKPEQLKKALAKGYPVVLCPRLPFYFDFMQDASQRLGRKWAGHYITLDTLYNFSIENLPINKDQQHQILGMQAALWTEVITTRAKLEYMLFPRIAALAEASWTFDNQKNLPGFRARAALQLKQYEKAGIYYYNPFHPEQTPEPLTAKELSK